MKDKKVLIIGAGSQSKADPSIKGIGTCLVEKLAEEGCASILFTYCTSKIGARQLMMRTALYAPTCRIEAQRFNAVDYKREWDILERRISKSGTPDIFIYNAGLRFYKADTTEEEREQVMAVNYHCPIYLIEKISMMMEEDRKRGRIIVTSSAIAGQQHPYLQDYCESKGLLEAYINRQADHLRDLRIGSFIVSPNITRTPMTEERLAHYQNLAQAGAIPHIMEPQEIANQIYGLCL